MTTTKHTPGPWKVTYANGDYYVGTHSVTVADCTSWSANTGQPDSPRTGAEAEANARLIAAAPEMYDTLRTIADFAVGNGDVCEIIAKRARAAIRKAEEGQ